MGLAERIVQSDTPTVYPHEDGTIPIHEFTAAMTLLAAGEVTKSQLVTLFAFDATEEAGLDTLIAAYIALPTTADKVMWLMKLEAAGIFFQDGNIDKAKYKSIMGLV